MGQVASLFTIFTHHAKTFRDLMWSLRNALINTQAATDQKREEQVAKVIELDVHVERSSTGRRYIERITECIYQEHDDSALEKIQSGDGLESKMDALIAIKRKRSYVRQAVFGRIETLLSTETENTLLVNPYQRKRFIKCCPSCPKRCR